jgi:hypothetical protein
VSQFLPDKDVGGGTTKDRSGTAGAVGEVAETEGGMKR